MMTFEELADELYGTLPEGFTAARDECVKRARATGDGVLARELAKLRRPTQSAWLVNQLARDEQAPLDDLLGLVDEYGQALSERDGARLTELTTRRRRLETQLIARASELAAEAGALPSDSTLQEVRDTLDAAVSDPDFANEVREGRLVKGAAPTWGASAETPSVRAPKAGAAGKSSSPPKKVRSASKRTASKVPRTDGSSAAAAATADEVTKAAAEAERAARAAREQAASELAERTADAERANAAYESLSERLEQLRAEARNVAQQVAAARQGAVRAERRRAQAERRHQKLS